MTDHEVERALGYTPCVCGKIDGTWHVECYRGGALERLGTDHKRAFSAARRHLKAAAAKIASTAGRTQP